MISYRIVLFAPGGYDPDPSRVEHARAYFEARGHRVTLAFDPHHSHQRFSADDDERFARAMQAMANDDVDLAIALRGGYGATRLLPRLDFDAIAIAVGRGLRIVGHSDLTAIELALLATTGARSFAGPMASFDFGAAIDPFTEAQFWRAMDQSRVAFDFATTHEPLEVEGVLWGGNLAMLASLVGTPWMPAMSGIEGGILFVEDVNERPYRVERMLLQLHQAGVLERQRAVLAGAFSGAPADYDHGYGIDDVLEHVRTVARVPIIAGLPFGHVPTKATLAVGVAARVRVDGGRCFLSQHWSD